METKLTREQQMFVEMSMLIELADFAQKNHRKPTREEFNKIADKVAEECAETFALADMLGIKPQPTKTTEGDQKTDTQHNPNDND